MEYTPLSQSEDFEPLDEKRRTLEVPCCNTLPCFVVIPVVLVLLAINLACIFATSRSVKAIGERSDFIDTYELRRPDQYKFLG